MMHTLMIRERADLKTMPSILHKIIAQDKGRGGYYQQVVSFQATFGRVTTRFSRFWYTPKRYSRFNVQPRFQRWDEVEQEIYDELRQEMASEKGTEAANKRYPELKVVEHESVWDFYKYIGFDYKDKSVKNTDTLLFISEKKNG